MSMRAGILRSPSPLPGFGLSFGITISVMSIVSDGVGRGTHTPLRQTWHVVDPAPLSACCVHVVH